MRIRGWHVEGFGIHRDWRVDDLRDGLTVFYGPNEAGKSTLLAFLRGVLFGFPDGRSNDPKYPPVGGGAHGGRVMLAAPGDAGDGVDPEKDGPVVVERFVGRGQKVAVALADGRAGSEADLAELLGHADARLFRSVFAFGLGELQELGSLGDAGIQDQLFAAGVTGGGTSARRALRDLHEAARERFAGVRARKQDRARSLIDEITAVNSDLYVRQEAAERYPELREREQALAAELADLERERERQRLEEQRARRLVELWTETWSPLAELREQAAKLAPSVAARLPADAAVRLEQGLQQVESDGSRLAALREEQGEVAAQQAELRLDESARAAQPRVGALYERLALHRSQAARLDEIDRLRLACDARIGAVLARLGPGFGEPQLAGLRPVAARCEGLRDELRGFQARLDDGRQALGQETAAVRLAAAQQERGREQVTELSRQAAQQTGPDPAVLGARAEALRGLRVLLPRLREAELDLERRTTLLARHEPGSGALAGVVPVVLMLLGVAGLGAVLVRVGRWDWAVVLAAVTAALAVSRGVLLARRRRAQARARRLEEEAVLECGEQLAGLRDEARRLLEKLGPGEGEPAAAREIEQRLVACEDALDQDRERAAGAARLADELRGARARQAVLDAEHEVAVERRRVAEARLEQEASAFAGWKAELGIPGGCAPDEAMAFLDDVRRGSDALDERDRLDAERLRLDGEVSGWRAEVDAVLAATDPDASGEPAAPVGDEGRIDALSRLRERCEADRAARERREPLERRAGELRDRIVACEASLATARAALARLLEEAGVDDAEQLRRRIDAQRAAGEIAERIGQAEAELERRLQAAGPREGAVLREELPHGRVTAWEERAREARRRVAELEARRDAVLREHQDRARACERLEQETSVMDLELHKSALEQELREVVDDWRQLRLAARLVESALDRFEGQHQPGVLREASRLFDRVTAGRYPRIVQSDGRAGFSVLTASGTHRETSELSRGTTEQLYLCIRLGLVAELARGGRALPVVMDDVLVNFDDERAAAMAAVLADFASEHQLFFFTCSSRTRDLLAALGPSVEVRNLGAEAA